MHYKEIPRSLASLLKKTEINVMLGNNEDYNPIICIEALWKTFGGCNFQFMWDSCRWHPVQFNSSEMNLHLSNCQQHFNSHNGDVILGRS